MKCYAWHEEQRCRRQVFFTGVRLSLLAFPDVPGRHVSATARHGLGWCAPEGQASHIQQDHPSHTANTGAADSLPLLLDTRQHTQWARRTLKLGLGQGFFHTSHETCVFFLLQPAVRRKIKRINVIYVKGQKEGRSSCYMLYHASDMEGLLLSYTK